MTPKTPATPSSNSGNPPGCDWTGVVLLAFGAYLTLGGDDEKPDTVAEPSTVTGEERVERPITRKDWISREKLGRSGEFAPEGGQCRPQE